MFSPTVIRYWLPQTREVPATGSLVVVDPSLGEKRSLSVLSLDDGPTVVTVTPERAHQLGVVAGQHVDIASLRDRIADAGLTLHDADNLFYVPDEERVALRNEATPVQTRSLSAADTSAFAAFTAEAPDDELDEAFVELDHWLVFGTFVGDRLAAISSMYAWAGSTLADLGVITLPSHRGHGFARQTVRAISRRALELGYEPQYRCQLDNTASAALATSAGFRRFGEWQAIDLEEKA